MAQSQYTRRCALAQLDYPLPFHPDQLRHAQQGCADCLDHLVRKNERLIHWVLYRFRSGTLPYEEALQAGRIGLWQALLRFDPTRGTTFSTYAVVAIRRRIGLAEQRFQRFWRPLPQIPTASPADPLDAIQRLHLIPAVRRWIEQLPARLGYVLRAYYGLHEAAPQTQRAIAQDMGLTHQRVQQLLQQARLLLALPLYSWEIRLLLDRTSARDVQVALRAWYRLRQRQRGQCR